ncbi:hypothetical protein EY643_03790 [Halioglobus maricola]|uniref:Type 4 fimbrial biogenesis protein PilX N-terminal domain-containing protein n=1 Tax=Halioglobus maricola TaxID=2601894 RepID=A0A5P9NH37_9GAMM|nr:hypothetical protein [Halioglobus maricola]QFU74836.1 hypothetical protein EY643_03790 [Halioglobus maricola]
MCCAVDLAPGRETGAVLVFALVFLGLLALLTAAISESNLLQLRLAHYLEARMVARQAALGRVERVLEQHGRLPPSGVPGSRHCAANSLLADCATNTLGPDGEAQAYIEVLARENDVPPRLRQHIASSAIAYESVQYEVVADARVNAATIRVHQGVLLLHPRGQ